MAPVLSVISMPLVWWNHGRQAVVDYLQVYDKNRHLEEDNRALRQQLLTLSQMKIENERLRRLLRFTEEHNHIQVTARVVGDVSGPYIRSVMINAGSLLGVAAGQAVVSGDGLVGRVIEVGEKTARILLITDINSRIPILSSLTRERAIMAGNNR